jgi:hypothetical protein
MRSREKINEVFPSCETRLIHFAADANVAFSRKEHHNKNYLKKDEDISTRLPLCEVETRLFRSHENNGKKEKNIRVKNTRLLFSGILSPSINS